MASMSFSAVKLFPAFSVSVAGMPAASASALTAVFEHLKAYAYRKDRLVEGQTHSVSSGLRQQDPYL